MAKVYAKLFAWPEAESHFALAAQDPSVQKEALAGLEEARRNIVKDRSIADARVMETGDAYLRQDLDAKAEEVYRGAATNSALSSTTRAQAVNRLLESLAAQRFERSLANLKDGVVNLLWLLTFALGLLLLYLALRTIRRSRRSTVIRTFVAPKDEIARNLSTKMKYARAIMRNPALSPVGVMPAALLQDLFLFEDELATIEDLELAGAKIPFASLAKVFGEPKVEVTGGYDGASGSAMVFAEIKMRDAVTRDLCEARIAVGTPAEEADLLNFIYDVLRRT
jgi:hypothetical protein